MGIIIGVVAGIVVTVLGGYVLFRITSRISNIRYSVGTPIQYSNDTGKTEYAQEIRFQNDGTAETEVSIQIPNYYGKLEIRQKIGAEFNSTDTGDGHHSIKLDKLRPEESFSIVARGDKTLDLNDINVHTSHGVVNRGANKRGIGGLAAYSTLYFLIPSAYLVVIIYSGAASIAHSSARSRPDRYLLREKPWYFLQSTWDNVCETATKSIPYERYLLSLHDTNAYRLLSHQQPDWMGDYEWTSNVDTWSDSLVDAAKFLVNTRPNTTKTLLERYPQSITSDARDQIEAMQLKLQLDPIRQQILDANDIEALDKALRQVVPAEIELADRKSLNRIIEVETRRVLMQHFRFEEAHSFDELPQSIQQVVDQQDRDMYRLYEFSKKLSKYKRYGSRETAEALLANNLSALLPQYEAGAFRDFCNLAIEVDEQKKQNEIMIQQLHAILRDAELDADTLKLLDNDISNSIVNMSTRYAELRRSLAKGREAVETMTSEILAQRMTLDADRKKVLAQLAVINDMIEDPTSLDRVEEYQIPFAEGNWVRLKQLATQLKEMDSAEKEN